MTSIRDSFDMVVFDWAGTMIDFRLRYGRSINPAAKVISIDIMSRPSTFSCEARGTSLTRKYRPPGFDSTNGRRGGESAG